MLRGWVRANSASCSSCAALTRPAVDLVDLDEPRHLGVRILRDEARQLLLPAVAAAARESVLEHGELAGNAGRLFARQGGQPAASRGDDPAERAA